MMEPKPPPSRMAVASWKTFSSSTAAPPENHDAAAGEGALHNVAHALGQGADGDFFLFINLFRLRLLDVAGGQLDFDDMGAQLRGDLRGVTAHINGRLPLLAQGGPARVRPDDHRQPGPFGQQGRLLDLLGTWSPDAPSRDKW